MKPYFAKHLPVEGDVRGGDKVAWDIRNNILVGITGSKTSINLIKNEDYKPAKLFLCSRDIQVGDEAHIPYPSGEARITPTKHTIISIRNVVAKNNGYKVIGEISPEAIWVKEGDEFDYGEVNIHTSYNKDTKKFDIPHHVEIKCPICKTFH